MKCACISPYVVVNNISNVFSFSFLDLKTMHRVTYYFSMYANSISV